MAIGTIAALGAASAGLGLAKGIGGAVAASRSFTPEQKRRLAELEGRRRRGELGLEEEERDLLEGQLASARGAALRQAEVQGAQARQAARASGAGRDLFLAEVAGAEAQQQARAEGAKIIAEQEAAARQAQQQELAGLQAQQGAARAGVVSALTGGIAAGAEAGLGMAAQYQMQELEYTKQAEIEGQRLQAAALNSGLYSREELDALMGG
jgi:hypothetical protein